MNYGLDSGKFFIEYKSSVRPRGNMREESERYARELADQKGKYILGLSGGMDSQSVLHSFCTQGIPIETVFFYSPGYNDNEFEQVKILDKKYGVKTQILDIDPNSVREEIDALSVELDLPSKNSIRHSIFLSRLPDDYDFIVATYDPLIFVSPTDKLYYCIGYNYPEISRNRAYGRLQRKGKNIPYGVSAEFLLSILDDEILRSVFIARKYFDGNGLMGPMQNLKTTDRWDVYIKPIMYGKYWGDELIYFPKSGGAEKINFVHAGTNYRYMLRDRAVAIPFEEFISFLKTQGGVVKRFYQNTTTEGYDKNNIIQQVSNYKKDVESQIETLSREVERLNQEIKRIENKK